MTRDDPRISEGGIIMQVFKTPILVASLVALGGCSHVKQSDVCVDRWYGYHSSDKCPAPIAARDLAAELAAAQNEIQSLNLRLSTVKGLLADREREVADLRSRASESSPQK